jgi:hypothetical protein
MTTSTRHDAPIWPARARAWATLLLAAMAWPLGGCAVGVDGGPYDDGGVGYVGGYYEPYGYEVGGWGGGYHVGPGRGGERGGRGQAAHAYRAAPAGRSAPSIASHSRHR